jgi:phage gpG-like protein
MTISDLQKKLNNLLSDVVDQDLMTKIAKSVKSNVQTRTRRGFGVDSEGGPAKKLKPLADSYKKQRKRIQAAGGLSQETTPNKSNLTNTGEMINAIDYEVTRNEATVFVTGIENRKKAKYQADADRKFMNLSKREIKDITDIIEQSLETDITKKGL